MRVHSRVFLNSIAEINFRYKLAHANKRGDKMSEKEHNDFGKKLAFHSAPTLLGIKCASLISLSPQEFCVDVNSEMFNKRVESRGLKSRILCNCGRRTLLIIYNERLLSKRIADPEMKDMLSENGYPENGSIEDCLDHLAERICKSCEFPHEIGIFLGYPLDDILGFIENKGENFKLCGCWKVYGSEETARKTFANYDKCRRFLCNKLTQGADIYQALRIS